MSWDEIKNFQSSEFDSPDSPGSGVNMNLNFVEILDSIRDSYGHPLSVHSGYRTPEHNAQVGGVDASAHEEGKAADLSAPTSQERFALVALAVRKGIRRIGIGKTFVHLDVDETKPQDVLWLYP